MNLFDFIKAIWDALTPLVLIYSYQGGVRWTLGRNPKELKPGVHFKLWPIQDIEIVEVVDTYIELPIQSVITKDEQLLCFSAAIAYKIFDPVKHFCEVNDFHDAIEDIAMMHLAQRVREKTYAELIGVDGQKDLETSLSGTLTTRVKDWGTQIIKVGFTNIAKVPFQFRMFGAKDE